MTSDFSQCLAAGKAEAQSAPNKANSADAKSRAADLQRYAREST